MIPRNHQVTEMREPGDAADGANPPPRVAQVDVDEGAPTADGFRTHEIRQVPNEPTVIQGPADRGDTPPETVGSDDCCDDDDETDQ